MKYLIEGRRWFQKTYGNTYHTVTITDLKTGEVIHKSKEEYGYGDHYRQTAKEWLIKQGLLIKEKQHDHEYMRANFLFKVVDVPREKDL